MMRLPTTRTTGAAGQRLPKLILATTKIEALRWDPGSTMASTPSSMSSSEAGVEA